MNKSLLFGILLVLLSSCGSVKKYNEAISEKHSIAELHTDVDAAYNQLKKYHPKLYQYTPKEQLDFKFDSLKQAITAPMASRAFYEKLAAVVTNVHQGHISVSPPNIKRTRKERKEFRDKKLAFNTMDFEYLDSKLWVTDAKAEDSVLIGSQVVTIEGETPTNLIKKYNTLIASDGFNQTLFDGMVGSRFPRYYYKNKGFVDSLQITFKTTDSVFDKTFSWKKPEKKKDSIFTDSVENSAVKVKRVTASEKKEKRIAARNKRKYNNKYGYVKSTDEFTRIFNFIGADSTIAYMKIRGFSNGSYDEFYEESFTTMDSLGTKNLIIDLRDNGGGRLNEIDELYSYLTDTEYTFIEKSEIKTRVPFLNSFLSNTNPDLLRGAVLVFSPVIATLNILKTEKENGILYYKWRNSKPQEPKEKNYKGNLYVLINGNSFSASSVLSTHLKATNRATFVGQETGGAYNGTVAGLFRGYELPNSKVVIRMGLMQIEAPYKVEPDGFGVTPDVEITPTRKDREEGRDPELQYVLDMIGEQ
ncbi:S41 family peptidase [Jejudonia soesokkakensis]|uniref:S41 family peptidase n=1 Tax=Jejudonia soesokkakensis TaxID=1323432 RepID=A0ABW2MXY1_9FLAO